MAFNEEQFIRDMLGATGGKVTIEKGTLNKSFEEMKEDLEKVFKPREPLFTLTAEEIDYLKQLLEEEISDLYKTQILYSNTHIWLVKINKANNLLTRIKQWQDENNRTTKEDN